MNIAQEGLIHSRLRAYSTYLEVLRVTSLRTDRLRRGDDFLKVRFSEMRSIVLLLFSDIPFAWVVVANTQTFLSLD